MSEQTLNLGREANAFPPIRVLVADDSDLIRRAVRHLLAEEQLINCVGEAENFAQAFELCSALKPKIVLIDLHMRDDAQFESSFAKSALDCAEHVLAMSLWNDPDTKERADKLGAKTLLDKNTLASTLVPTILEAVRAPLD